MHKFKPRLPIQFLKKEISNKKYPFELISVFAMP